MEKYIKIPRFLKHIKIGDEMERKYLKKKKIHTQADLTPKTHIERKGTKRKLYHILLKKKKMKHYY